MVKEVVHSNIIMNEEELRRHSEIQMDSFLQGAKLGKIFGNFFSVFG